MFRYSELSWDLALNYKLTILLSVFSSANIFILLNTVPFEIMFCAGSDSAHHMLEVSDGENLQQSSGFLSIKHSRKATDHHPCHHCCLTFSILTKPDDLPKYLFLLNLTLYPAGQQVWYIQVWQLVFTRELSP